MTKTECTRQDMNLLPKESRVLFAMYVSGFKYSEIAQKMNLPLNTVKSRIFLSRQYIMKVNKC